LNSVLAGASVIVAGGGLAGLVAARDLMTMGANVILIEARSRLGGRVWTIREGFADHHRAEGGGEFIDESHHEIRRLVGDLGLTLVRVLRSDWGFVRPNPKGSARIERRGISVAWQRLGVLLSDDAARLRLAEGRWDSPIARHLARSTVAQWLDAVGADEAIRSMVSGLRGFFLADADELSLLSLVDQIASEGQPGAGPMYRIDGGNDRLASGLAAQLGARIRLGSELVAVSQRGRRVRASVKNGREVSQIEGDYLVFALPATLMRRIPVTPALPTQQHEAIARLRYGRATKTLLQFSTRFWRAPGRPRAIATPLPVGAVWDANEEQRGRAGVLTVMAGGSASDATRRIIEKEGIGGLTRSLDWLGARRAELLAWRQAVWENDPWARGGYAVFDAAYDPASRDWLARASGRLFFAGEHTSATWQGYMNGAVESGRRAAAEISATHHLMAAGGNRRHPREHDHASEPLQRGKTL
jgi:monoamine oxidase